MGGEKNIMEKQTAFMLFISFGIGMIVAMLILGFTGNISADRHLTDENYELIFLGCKNFCLNNSQEYYGVDNYQTPDRTCACSNQTYPIYRQGVLQLQIFDNTGVPTSSQQVEA